MHFFSASPLFSTHPVYSTLARWSRLAISALVLPLFLPCSFHQKSFFLTVLVFVCLSLSDTHRHSNTHTHLSFFPCTYCMSLRQTVSVIGLFFSSPVWCTETHTHPCTHIQSMHTHAQTHTEFDLCGRFCADCCWGRRSAAMRVFLFGPVRVCRAGVWLDTWADIKNDIMNTYSMLWSVLSLFCIKTITSTRA